MRIGYQNLGNINRIRNLSNLLIKRSQQLATAKRINNAANNPANMAIAQNMNAQIRSLYQVNDQIQNGVAMLNVADSGLQRMNDILSRMRELAVQAGNTIYGPEEREALQAEFNNLRQQLNELSRNTEYNGIRVLAGEVNNVEVPTNPNGEGQQINIPQVNAETLGLNNLNLTNPENIDTVIQRLDEAIQNVGNVRANIGANMNGLERAANEIVNRIENQTNAVNVIEGADMARQMMDYIRVQMQREAAMAVTAQGNNLNITNIMSVLRAP